MQIPCVILSSLAGLRRFVEINDRMIFVERNYFMYNTISIQDAETGKKISIEVKRKRKRNQYELWYGWLRRIKNIGWR